MSDHQSSAASLIGGRNGAPLPQQDDSEGTRYSDQQVVFEHEFRIGARGDLYPPGRYVIEVAENSYAAGAHTAHVRQSASLIVSSPSGTRAIPINVAELDAALEKDAEHGRLAPSDGASGRAAAKATAEPTQPQLERYGIERVPADVFVWSGYRYTNASDAIAAARRAERR